MDAAAQLYPIALDLRGRRCVVVGGGAVGARKAQALAETGAEIIIIAPEMSDRLTELAAQNRVTLCRKPFDPADVAGAFLVIAATDSPHVNSEVANAARAIGALFNLAAPSAADAGGGDNSGGGGFATMATLRRGELLLAVTTGGAGPALSARLKRELEAQFGPEWAAYVSLLREVREAAYRQRADTAAEALRRLAARDDVREKIAAGKTEAARQEAMSCLSL